MRSTTLQRVLWILSIALFEVLTLSSNRVAAQKVTAPVPAELDQFGYSVALGDSAMLVGAPFHNTLAGTWAGAAYIFPRDLSGLHPPQLLFAAPGGEQYFYGCSLAIAGDTAVVGAYGDGAQGSFAGAAYVYVRNAGSWSLQQKLTAADHALDQYFGWSVAIDGDTIAVGAIGDASHGTKSGAAYVYSRSGTVWSQQQKLSPSTLLTNSMGGIAVAVLGDVLAMGAIGDVDNGVAAGAVYAFTRSAGHWTQSQKLVAASGSANDDFGFSLALAPSLVVIGAEGDDQNGTDAGALHVFAHQDGHNFSLKQKLTGEHAGDLFGYSVAASPSTVLAGAAGVVDRGSFAGAVYRYAVQTGEPQPLQLSRKLYASDAREDALFGSAAAIRNSAFVVGAKGDAAAAPEAGAAYAFGLVPEPAPALGSFAWLLAFVLVALACLAVRRGARLRAVVLSASILALFSGCDAGEAPVPQEAAVVAQAVTTTDSLTFNAAHDAAVKSSKPNSAFGTGNVLDLNRTLVDFDAAAIKSNIGPTDYVITASLELTLARNAQRRTPTNLLAFRLTQIWSETTATWECAIDLNPFNNAADCSPGATWSMDAAPNPWATPATATTLVPPTVTGKITLDVAADVRAFVAGQNTHFGWMLRGSGVAERDEFASRESGTPPRLLLSVRRCSPAQCDDGNPCTVDSCGATAECTNTPAANGTTCTDGNACTVTDTCQAGTCTAGTPKTCAGSDACHAAGTCDPGSGLCSNPVAANGTACSDGDACTQSDSCQAGLCLGANPVVCPSADACHPAICSPSNGSCSVTTACTLYGTGNIPPNTRDGLVVTPATLQSGLSNNQIGAFGSAIAYTGAGNLYIATPDRGPNDGNDSYTDRYYQLEITLNAGMVTPRVVGASTLNKVPGTTFTGFSSEFDASNSTESRRFDPEGVRVSPAGTFFTSDEYGPFLYEFGADGNRIRALNVPHKFLIDHPSATAELPPANTKGRQLNRGMEGLAISPDGSKLYGLMQNALIQDGALDSSNRRVALNSRLLEIDVATGTTREFLYVLADKAYGMNELLAVNDHQFLVIERDGNAGSAAAFKRLFLIDIAGATDISGVASLPAASIPPGVVPVQKQPFLDLLAPEYGLVGPTFPEKIEGLTFGPDLPDGRHVLIVTNDNDFLATNNNNFYVFSIGSAALPQLVHAQATFSSACANVACSAADACHVVGSCNPSTGVCTTPPAAAGTPVGMQTPGDCKKHQCDGTGQIVDAPDDTDISDDANSCTADVCSSGTPEHNPVTAGTACNQNGGQVCDATGSCVACLSASDCSGTDDACSVRACNAGVCSRTFVPEGTAVGTQASGDCHRLQCDGQGNTENVVDDADLPVDGNPCTNDVCMAGTPSNPPAAVGLACGMNQVCDGAGACVGCAGAANCPGVDNECQVRTCTAGVCGTAFTVAGTPVQGQSAGDCRRNVCDGTGAVVPQIDDNDVPNDSNACTNDVCSQGMPSHTNQPAGTSCTENGGTTCNAAGQCAAPTLRVIRIGDGAGALSSAAQRVFVEERKLDGSLVSTIALPTTVSTPNRALTMSGSATSEGALSLSADGRYITLAGYDAAVGTTGIPNTPAIGINRVAARIDAAGNVDTSTTVNNQFSGNNVRGATTLDGTSIWLAGASGGVVFAPLGNSAGGTQVATGLTNVRTVNIFDGQLYGSASTGSFTNVFKVGAGTPTTSQTATSLPGMPTSGASPYAFALLDLSPSPAGVDTLYVADDRSAASGGGVQKWQFSGSTWALVGTWTNVTGQSALGFRGLTALKTGNDVTVVATSAAANDVGINIVKFVDTGAGAPLGSIIATAAQNTVFRGLAFSPHP